VRRGLLALLSATLLTGCGGGASPASSQLRIQATRACGAAERRLQRITPGRGGYVAFLKNGIAVLEPEVRRLGSLHPRAEDQAVFDAALAAIRQEITALKGGLSGLERHQDPALTFAALQRRLTPLESRADAAWRALQIPACLSR
jgi:hypothetical protein